MMDYKTLEELDVKVGDTVVYKDNSEYKVGPDKTLIFPDGASLKYNGWDKHRCFTLKGRDMTVGSIKRIGAKVGDVVQCVSWVGDYYNEGEFYPVVYGLGVRGKSIGTGDTRGLWKIVETCDLPYGHVKLSDGLIFDLTAIEKPLGLLTREVKDALTNHTGPFEYFANRGWSESLIPCWTDSITYRVKSKPKVEHIIRWATDVPAHGTSVDKGYIYKHKLIFTVTDGKLTDVKMEKEGN